MDRMHDLLKNVEISLAQKSENIEPTIDISISDDHDSFDSIIVEQASDNLEEYKQNFLEMSVGSLRAAAIHAQHILDSLDNPSVKENLTESWLQGKIAIVDDYMRTIHDFIMYVAKAADTISAADKPGLWDNIRKKKQKEGKKYRPARPGDKNRPDSDQWKKLTK